MLVVRSGVIPLVAVALVLAGCGSSNDGAASSPEPQSATGTTEAAAAESDEVVDAGDMIVTYEDATTPEAINGKKIFEDNEVLQGLAEGTNEMLKLPFDIPLLGAQCDEPNAFWNSADRTMTLCYEYADYAQALFTEAGDADPLDAALSEIIATFYHEMGHMVIDIYDLPTTGREEDVADQLAAFLLLMPDDNGQLDPETVDILLDDARMFALMSDGGEYDESAFADEHSLNETRMYNMLCWTYGADPEMNSHLVDNEVLPVERADRCEDEYDRMSSAWATLLVPYIKE
jgi:ATP-dependent protease HslVU (ClpYQ) peptidase subunit